MTERKDLDDPTWATRMMAEIRTKEITVDLMTGLVQHLQHRYETETPIDYTAYVSWLTVEIHVGGPRGQPLALEKLEIILRWLYENPYFHPVSVRGSASKKIVIIGDIQPEAEPKPLEAQAWLRDLVRDRVRARP